MGLWLLLKQQKFLFKNSARKPRAEFLLPGGVVGATRAEFTIMLL